MQKHYVCSSCASCVGPIRVPGFNRDTSSRGISWQCTVTVRTHSETIITPWRWTLTGRCPYRAYSCASQPCNDLQPPARHHQLSPVHILVNSQLRGWLKMPGMKLQDKKVIVWNYITLNAVGIKQQSKLWP